MKSVQIKNITFLSGMPANPKEGIADILVTLVL